MAAAAAAAAKRRAEKMGLTFEEVDEGNVGSKSAASPPSLAHPFLGKIKEAAPGQLSPRSKRLKEMEAKEATPAPAAPAPPAPPPAAAAPAPTGPQIDLGAPFSQAAAAKMRAVVAQGGQQQHRDALAVMKRWGGAPGTRDELAGSEDAFGVLADVSMGPHEAERDGAVEQIRALCEDEKFFGLLTESMAAFGPLQNMMSSSNLPTQMAGIELFASLCERDMPEQATYSAAHSPCLSASAQQDGANVRGYSGLNPDDAIEDAEEALAKVIAAAQGHVVASPSPRKPDVNEEIDPADVPIDMVPQQAPEPAAPAPAPAPPTPPPPAAVPEDVPVPPRAPTPPPAPATPPKPASPVSPVSPTPPGPAPAVQPTAPVATPPTEDVKQGCKCPCVIM